ncbi:MAG: hypothetical protein KAT85_02735 [candidate division Zixibacteria bacterium]|jgi:hypothetical protein|nr:hypothetical protein [candidate division Zixibacteria bacterium]
MEQFIDRIISEFPIRFGNLSVYLEQFDQYMTEHLGAIPLPLIYLFCVVATVLLIYGIVRFLLRVAFFVVVPTIGSALVITYAFPALEAAKIMPIAGIFFIILFIFKH